MQEQIAVQQFLREKLTEIQIKNPSYSLRAFAARLGIGAGPLSQILSGQRNVSKKMAERFCDALLADPVDRKRLFSASNHNEAEHEEYLRLSSDQFQIISEWYYFAILSLINTKGFRNDPIWIAKRLGISISQAGQAVDRLLRLGMVEEVAHHKLKRCKPRYRTTDDVANLSLRKSHFQNLELAKASLETDPVEHRDFTAITMPADLKNLPEAKQLIRKFEQDLCAMMMNSEAPTEVYRMMVGLFPLTKIQNKSDERNKK